MKIKFHHIEVAIHGLFLLLYFSSINVAWTANWLDPSIRPNTPAPLLALIFPFYFYIHAFWLIPQYLNREKWRYYLWYAPLVFFIPELLRATLMYLIGSELSFFDELMSRDSFIFGAPSPFFIALNASFLYRFIRDRFIKFKETKEATPTIVVQEEPVVQRQNSDLVPAEEAKIILQKLAWVMKTDQPYLDQELSLRTLAEMVDTSDKKLSFLLNQQLNTKFYDYINQFRVEEYIQRITSEKSPNLTQVGIALNCGFKSKSSFYRVFKNHTGMSPNQYLKGISS